METRATTKGTSGRKQDKDKIGQKNQTGQKQNKTLPTLFISFTSYS